MSAGIPALAPGAAVAVVAPAGPVDPARLERGLAALRALGVVPSEGTHLRRAEGYLAGTDAERADDLTRAFIEPGTGGVLYARGGYGTTRLLPRLDLPRLAASGKLLLGYSDATALGLALSRQTPYPFLHGPTVSDLGAEPQGHDEASLRAGLFGLSPNGEQRLAGLEVLRPGRVEATVFGGCLSLIVSLLGTPYLPDLSGRILLIEEVGEEPYRIDRMLTQLRLAGVLERLAGLLAGQFTACDPRPGRSLAPSAAEAVARSSEFVPGPVLAGLPVGHGRGRQTVPLGVPARIDADSAEVVFRHAASPPRDASR